MESDFESEYAQAWTDRLGAAESLSDSRMFWPSAVQSPRSSSIQQLPILGSFATDGSGRLSPPS